MACVYCIEDVVSKIVREAANYSEKGGAVLRVYPDNARARATLREHQSRRLLAAIETIVKEKCKHCEVNK